MSWLGWVGLYLFCGCLVARGLDGYIKTRLIENQDESWYIPAVVVLILLWLPIAILTLRDALKAVFRREP